MSKVTAIAGLKFNVTTPYAEGHAVTEAEAQVLNQTRAENIGNNLRSKVNEYLKAAIEKVGGELNDNQREKLTAQIQGEVVDKYDTDYKLEAKRVSAPRVVNPVEKEAYKLATESLVAAICQKFEVKISVAKKILKGEEVEGVKVPAGASGKLQEKLETMVERGGKIWKQAEANVKKTQEATQGILEDLGL